MSWPQFSSNAQLRHNGLHGISCQYQVQIGHMQGFSTLSLTVCVHVCQVSDGDWKDEVPAPENVQIINYLNIVRPLPYDEQYLSSSYDVTHLLCQLKGLGDRQIREEVMKIATAVVTLEDVPASDTDTVEDTLKKFKTLLDDN